jgi:hypothetical protein
LLLFDAIGEPHNVGRMLDFDHHEAGIGIFFSEANGSELGRSRDVVHFIEIAFQDEAILAAVAVDVDVDGSQLPDI